MLADKTSSAVIAVKDMARAKEFYEGKLGLSQADMGMDDSAGGVMYKTGSSRVLVYPTQYAGTNQATAIGWGCGEDLGTIVDELKSKRVSFEHYSDMPRVKMEGDVHVMGELKAAWFKDPDGNILNLVIKM